MRQTMPCGAPMYFEKRGNKFTFEIAANKSGYSLEALDWLGYMSYDSRFENPCGGFYPMRTALAGEMSIRHNGLVYSVDGFVQAEDHCYFLEYYGCRYVGYTLHTLDMDNEILLTLTK